MPTTFCPQSFAQDNFGAACLNDKRRTRSLVDLAERITRHPGGSLPDKLADPLAYRRCCDLMNTPAVTHAAVLAPHYQHTLQQMQDYAGVILIIHDTTELDFTSHRSVHDQLGYIGDGGGRGYECHNSLAITANGQRVFGLVNQILHERPQVPANETMAQSRERASRESLLWVRGSAAVPAAPPGRLWVEMCDRGGDTYEFLDDAVHRQRSIVVRSHHNRRIQVGHDAQGPQALLHTHLRTLASQGQRDVTIHDHDTGAERQATVQVAWAAVRLRMPKNRRGHFRTPWVDVWAVRVWEEQPPAGVAAVEWFLLTTVPVLVATDAWERVDWYLRRWVVEEYHKVQKTGCQLEDPQFTSAAALQPMLALLSVVSVLLLNLRELGKHAASATLPATEVVAAEYVTVLSSWRYEETRPLTVREFLLALGRLGGHQNRKGDGLPGWLVLWRGWTKLQLLVAGYRAAQHVHAKKHTATKHEPTPKQRK